MEASSTTRSAGVLYRYRTGETLSAWMNADELRAHAADGRLTPASAIQQRGMDNWVAASKAAALWQAGPRAESPAPGNHGGNGNGAGPGGSTAGADALGDSSSGAHAAHDASGAEPAAHGGAHHTRLAESMQHLLQRALLGNVTVSAPEFDHPLRAVLAGVTVDCISLEFEACGSVVLVPWARVRSIALPTEHAHSTARIRTKAELLVIEVEHLPLAVGQAAQPA